MDQRQAERINQLAASLKELHLASSTEEAYARAKEIILGTSSEDDKSIKEMFKEQGLTDEIAEEIDALKEAETEERLDSQELTKEIKRVEQTLREHEKKLDEAHKILEKARLLIKKSRDGTINETKEYWEKHEEKEEEPKTEIYEQETPTQEPEPQENPEKKKTIDDMASN